MRYRVTQDYEAAYPEPLTAAKGTRLAVRREAGEHLFHRLLHADMSGG